MRTEAPIDLQKFLAKHSIRLRTIAAGTGLPISALSDIVNGKRRPRTDTVNKLLKFLRTVDHRVTYERIFYADVA